MAGDVPLTYRRDGKEYDIRVRLAGDPPRRRARSIARHRTRTTRPRKPPGRGKEPKPGDQPKPGEKPARPQTKPGDGPKPGEPGRRRNHRSATHNQNKIPKAVRQYYEESPGYTNYWFNRYNQQRVWNAYLAHGDFAETGWNWKITGKTAAGAEVAIMLTEKNGRS